jgi:hypothetical protein
LAQDYVLVANDIGPELAAEQRLGQWSELSFRDYTELLDVALEVLAKWRKRHRT